MRVVVIYGPQGTGKSALAQIVAEAHHMRVTVPQWCSEEPMRDNAVHITNEIDVDEKALAEKNNLRFVAVYSSKALIEIASAKSSPWREIETMPLNRPFLTKVGHNSGCEETLIKRETKYGPMFFTQDDRCASRAPTHWKDM